MKTKNLDIVYCVKEGNTSEELRYSLRSLKNMPHKKVYIYGGCPDWVNKKTVKHIPISQTMGNKWLNTRQLLAEIVKNPDISDNFIWFNDDFFIMHEVENLDYMYNRTLLERAGDFLRGTTYVSKYSHRLIDASNALEQNDKPTKNFELHVPIIFNKQKLAKIIEQYPTIGATRSLYCNTYVKEAIDRPDVKIYAAMSFPNPKIEFLSTSDASFAIGQVGKYLKYLFREPCKYEKEVKNG